MAESFVAVLRAHADNVPERRALTFLLDGESSASDRTYGELDAAAARIAGVLSRCLAPGSRALLVCPPGIDFVEAFLGCLYAGVVAVPVYPPDPSGPRANLATFRGIARDCGASAILTVGPFSAARDQLLQLAPELRPLQFIATDRIAGTPASRADLPQIGPDTVAFLQYTSGSTAQPKGVVLRHANLLANQRVIREGTGYDGGYEAVSWLPLYHDMGLIGFTLHPLFLGTPTTIFSPLHFLQRPARWLQAISRSELPVVSGAPDFGYELCVRRISDEDKRGLDLSRWTVAMSGAEPVRERTLRRFTEAFAGNGFSASAFFPCYGLAEATLMVSGGTRGVKPAVRTLPESQDADGTCWSGPVVSCGVARGETSVRIVDPDSGAALPEGRVGEIWLRGPSIAAGYWEKPDETERVFRAHDATGGGPFLRTGDLGAICDGELFVAGRLKDTLIERGRKIYPHDVESTIERSDGAIRLGCTALIGVRETQRDLLVALVEVRPDAVPDAAQIIRRVRAEVTRTHGIHLSAVALAAPRALPKTSSGKIRRAECRSLYEAGALNVLSLWREDSAA